MTLLIAKYGNYLVSEWSQENVYSIFENLCYNCNNVQCSCEKHIAKNETVDKQFQAHSIDEKNQYARSKVEKNNLSSSVTLYPTVPTYFPCPTFSL